MNSRLMIAAIVVFMMSPVWAHHSFAAYDMTRTLSAQATVKEFHWGAPHSTASFTLKDEQGKTKIVTMQGAMPSMMVKQGINPKDLRAGDKVEITWHPHKNGTPGGALKSMKFPDGRVFEDQEGNPQ